MQISTLQMEFLGNYLAELTLVEYGFLQYLPSMIAGSAVFLAKVTLDPTTMPWARYQLLNYITKDIVTHL